MIDLKGKIVLVTGATAGIGKACAELFGREKARLLLLARRRNRLIETGERLLREFGAETYNVECDVRDYSALKKAWKNLPKKWKKVDVLINNAGLAKGLEKIQDGLIENWETMIDTNVKGLLYVSRMVMPEMIERGEGTIINVASIAGRQAYPGGNVYCATKSAVKKISEAMAIDLNGTGVRVCNIDPGLVRTEFASVRFEGYAPLLPEDVAELAVFCATRPPRVTIQDALIVSTDQATATIVNKK